ncbi:hypothetical protein HYW43_04465 [Candidatus Daviesbacteria bacterium]|nr:hypothetical protein [Candidatus Daviesbacteria bacterium]
MAERKLFHVQEGFIAPTQSVWVDNKRSPVGFYSSYINIESPRGTRVLALAKRSPQSTGEEVDMILLNNHVVERTFRASHPIPIDSLVRKFNPKDYRGYNSKIDSAKRS